MGFLSVRPFNFRNLENRRVDCGAPGVFLVGDNGQGKTNFLEVVYLLCYGSSFRTRVDKRLIRHGCEEAAVEGILRSPGGAEVQIAVRLRPEKEIFVDGKAIRDRAELLEHVPCVVFCHDDFDFVNGPPERRRWFVNQTLSLGDPLYLSALRSYRRVLAARNVVVKQRSVELLEHYDAQLVLHGVEIQSRREAALRAFSAVFSRLYGLVSGLSAPVDLRYAPSWGPVDDPSTVEEALRARRQADLRMGTTTSGPHRDSYGFVSGETDFEHVASTGQLRLCSLVLRVAQAHFFLARTGRRPLLLLDDVILELDGSRKRAFVDNLPDRDQAFFTFLSDESYRLYRGPSSITYVVREGRVEQCNA